VLNYHYPNVPNFGDMTKFKEWNINGAIDLLVGGTPCQSFSVAGLRQGLKDPRGNLMLTFLAIAEHFKPKWILWENVPGVLLSNGGKDFGSFLGGLGELGYGFAYRVLDAQWCRTHRHPRAVPQRRRRVFVVGCAGDHISAAKVLFERESLQRYSAPRRATRQGIADNVEEGVGGGGDVVAATFTARTGEARNNSEHLVADVATVDARNNFDRRDSQHLDRLIPCWWDGGQVSQTLDAVLSKGQTMPEKNRFPAVLQPYNIVFSDSNGKRKDRINGGLSINKTDVSTSLTQAESDTKILTDVHAVALVQTMQVRRLTPTECERLQGFPDGWTAIPWKKKPADQCPDGPRYKALGNSMAVNCMEWLGERIQAVESGTL
jgi:DNA (cytosine-5)-methyltransferase 1